MTHAAPTFSVIVSSYNYEAHVAQAVDAALAQTHAPLEVIVVDDGSTDGSVALLKSRYGTHPLVRIVTKANGGQMSAWIEGLRHCHGDVVALLDSDDLWQPEYLARMAEVYQRDPSIDYVYCNIALFGTRAGLMLSKRRHRESRDLGLSVLMGACVRRWQGVATSGNTLRRAWLQRILALPDDAIAQWVSRPDVCLFYGSDILGAHKYYLAKALVQHREHDSNALRADQQSPLREARYAMRRERMLAHYMREAGYTPDWLRLAKEEFRTKPRPTWSECVIYMGLAWRAPSRISTRLGQMAGILAHWLRPSSRP